MENIYSTAFNFMSNIIAPDAIIQAAKIHRIDPKEKAEAIRLAKKLEPGDLILLRTPAKIFSQMRTLAGSYYDHMAVVLDKENSLHVSFPKAKEVPTFLFLLEKREPFVIRPTLSSEEKREFIEKCKQLIGKRYDVKKWYGLFFKLIVQKRFGLSGDNLADLKAANIGEKIICCESIIDTLRLVSKDFELLIESRKGELEYMSVGLPTISDLTRIAKGSTFFEQIFPEKHAMNLKEIIDNIETTEMGLMNDGSVMSSLKNESMALISKAKNLKKKFDKAMFFYKLGTIIIELATLQKNINRLQKHKITGFANTLLELSSAIMKYNSVLDTWRLVKPLTKLYIIVFSERNKSNKSKKLLSYFYVLDAIKMLVGDQGIFTAAKL